MTNQLPSGNQLSWAYVILTSIVLIYSVYAISLGAGLYGLHAIPAADSGSMRPVIDGCDIVVYSEDTELQEGDIGIFEPNWDWREFELVGHRVIDVHQNSYTFQGDAESSTEHIEQKNVRGTVEYIIPTRHLCQ